MSLSSPNAARRHVRPQWRGRLHAHWRHLRDLAAVALLAGGVLVALNGCSATFPIPTPPAASAALINGGNDGLLIPLHVERADEDHARLGLPVQLDGKPLYVALDTGTQGVRILKSTLPGSNYTRAGDVTSLSFANGAQVVGAAVTLPFSVAGTKPVPIAAQAVDVVRCLPSAKRCVAIDGYTGEFGWAFSGIAGVGADLRSDGCCTQPLRALPGNIGQRYLVHSNFAKPYLVLSPSSALTKDYTMLPMAASKDGATQWPKGCVRVADKMTFCAPLVFATGSSGMIRIETDKAPNWTGDDEVGKVLNQGNYEAAIGVGSWAHRYESAQVTIVKAQPDTNRIVVGLMAMQNIDVLFDFPRGQLGLYAAKASESFAP
ncbi:hypothetical protein LMG28614_00296 [Paraburkholderia ultramafica]|uniref:Aspartyl protease n=1 Tax=Paraburkholderia ultramafica TaxID=1544867 RepID=A0A6S7AT05_9BURK|nr:hypothetical protein [Paraburkholderia ultramafica]CAB3776846.1 hypothetical protein LMG28614_00296 [Paraburkholderia ultramafica]